MRNLYILAHTWQGIQLTVDIYHSPSGTMKALSELLEDSYPVKPDPDGDPEQFLTKYYEWVREENDNQCDVDVVLHIEKIPA